MTHGFKKVYEGLFCILLFNFQTTYSDEEGDKVANVQNNVRWAKLGEYCCADPCQDNQFCNEELVCQCRPGFKVYNNDCIPISAENEPCAKQEDCCGKLICINGICRKPIPNTEFITLAKICLGITVTTIMIAVLSSLLKCFIRYENSRVFQRQSDSSNFASTFGFRRRLVNRGSLSEEVRDEKPPSYEECIHSTGNPLADPPPYVSYVISTNSVIPTAAHILPYQTINSSVVNPQNLTTPLNVQDLNKYVNSDVTESQNLEKNSEETATASSS